MISTRSWLAVMLLAFASIASGHDTGAGGGGGGAGGAHASAGGGLAGGGGSHAAASGGLGGSHVATGASFAGAGVTGSTGSHVPAGGAAAAHAGGGVSPADDVRAAALMYSGAVSSDTLKGATVSHETIEGRPATVVHVKLPLTDAARRKLHRKGFDECESQTPSGREPFFCVRDPRDPLRCFDFAEQSAQQQSAARTP
jgi:hypothetical protein